MIRRTKRTASATATASATTPENPLILLSDTGFAERQQSSWFSRWKSFLSLPAPSEYLISVDHHTIWRRHLAWSHREGDALKSAVTSRFASNMVFLSLLLGGALATLFSPSRPAQLFREALAENRWRTVYFWGGIFLCVSISLTLSALLANFTAWAVIGAVHPANSHAVLRSSVGLYAAQLPARMVVLSVYCFAVWVVLFLFELLPVPWNYAVALFALAAVSHIVVVYSAFGRLVMYTKAMRKDPIFRSEEEDSMNPHRLFEELLERALREKEEDTPLPLFYRRKTEIRRQVAELASRHGMGADGGIGGSVSSHLSATLCKIMEAPEIGSMGGNDNDGKPSPAVGFADNLASIADSLADDGLVLVEEGDARSEEHPLKRNGRDRGMSAGHHRGYSAGGALGGHYRSPSGGRGGRGHKRESSGILLQRTMPPQSPAL